MQIRGSHADSKARPLRGRPAQLFLCLICEWNTLPFGYIIGCPRSIGFGDPRSQKRDPTARRGGLGHPSRFSPKRFFGPSKNPRTKTAGGVTNDVSTIPFRRCFSHSLPAFFADDRGADFRAINRNLYRQAGGEECL